LKNRFEAQYLNVQKTTYETSVEIVAPMLPYRGISQKFNPMFTPSAMMITIGAKIVRLCSVIPMFNTVMCGSPLPVSSQ